MAHLLMIESWVGGTGRLLPAVIRNAGHRYTFVTRNLEHYLDTVSQRIHPVVEHADNVLRAETNDTASLIRFLRQQHQTLRFDGVLTICDYYIESVAEIAHALELPHPFPCGVARTRRKHLVREALEQAGLPNPIYRVAGSWRETARAAGEIGYPLILKPVDLASSAFVQLVRDEASLHQAFLALERFPCNFRGQTRDPLWLLEEYMRGEEFSVEACTVDANTHIIGITDKSVCGAPFFIEDGHMFPASLDPGPANAIVDLVRRALHAVDFDHGISHTEVMLTSDGPRIVEINPRPGGNYIAELVEKVTGVDLLIALIDLALGRRPKIQPRETGIGSAAVHFLVPPHAGVLAAVEGLEDVQCGPGVTRTSFNVCAGDVLPEPVDNGCYLGHVVTVSPGLDARHLAQQAINRVTLRFHEDGPAVPAAPRAPLPSPENVQDLLRQVRAGRFGPDPASMPVEAAFWIRQCTRFPGTTQSYRNLYLLLRTGAVFGACCIEPEQLDPCLADQLPGRTLDELLTDARLPLRIAALDAYLSRVLPHTEFPQAQRHMLPPGAPVERAMARDALITGLLRIAPGQRVGLVGVVNPLVVAIRRAGGICLPCDYNMKQTADGSPVVKDMEPVLAAADIVIATGMTLGNGSFDRILAATRARGVPLVIYAQTGSAIVPRFLGAGVSAACAEPFPFSQFSADPSPVYLYRANVEVC